STTLILNIYAHAHLPYATHRGYISSDIQNGKLLEVKVRDLATALLNANSTPRGLHMLARESAAGTFPGPLHHLLLVVECLQRSPAPKGRSGYPFLPHLYRALAIVYWKSGGRGLRVTHRKLGGNDCKFVRFAHHVCAPLRALAPRAIPYSVSASID